MAVCERAHGVGAEVEQALNMLGGEAVACETLLVIVLHMFEAL